MALASTDYEVGLRVKAKDRTGKWYLASIAEIDEQDCDVCVHFEGWSHRHDEWVEFDTDRLRPLTPTTAQQFQPDIWKPKIGEQVRAKWTNKRLYPGKIVKILPEGEYNIKFKDGWALKVPFQDIRPSKKLHKSAVKLREPLGADLPESESDDEVIKTRSVSRRKAVKSPSADGSGYSSGGERGRGGSKSESQEEKPKPKKRPKRISSDSEDGESDNRPKPHSSKKQEKLPSKAAQPGTVKTKPSNVLPKTLPSKTTPAGTVPVKTTPTRTMPVKTTPYSTLHASRRRRSSSSVSSRSSSPPAPQLSPPPWTKKTASKQIAKAKQIVTRKKNQSKPPTGQQSSNSGHKQLVRTNKTAQDAGSKKEGDSVGKKNSLSQSKEEKRVSRRSGQAQPTATSKPKKIVKKTNNQKANVKETDSSDQVEGTVEESPSVSQLEKADPKEEIPPTAALPSDGTPTPVYAPDKPLIASSPTSLISPSLPIVLSGMFQSSDSAVMTANTPEPETNTQLQQTSSRATETLVANNHQTASHYEDKSSLSPTHKLMSSIYDVSVYSNDSEVLLPSVNPAVITIDPVQVAPGKFTRQQARGFAECAPLPVAVVEEKDEGEKESSHLSPTEEDSSVFEPPQGKKQETGSDSEARKPEVKRLKTTLIGNELPKTRLRSHSVQSPTDEPQKRSRPTKEALDPDRSPTTEGEDKKKGEKVSIVNVRKFKRMTGLDIPDGLKKRSSLKGKKEVVIDLDHNQFKCKNRGCNKSFRKESLLLWHIKHYHPGMKISKNVPVVPGLVTRPRRAPLGSPPLKSHLSSPGGPGKKVTIGKSRREADKTTAGVSAVVHPTTEEGLSGSEEKKGVKDETKTEREGVSENQGKALQKSSQQGTPTVLSSSLLSTATPPLVGRKPPLGRPPKRPSSETPYASQPTSPVGDIPVIKRLKQQPVTDATPTQLDTPKPSPKHQGLVRKRAAASARQRWKEICEAEDQSEDSLDSLNASWKSGSTDSASLLSLDIGFENPEGEARRGGKPWNSPERQSSNKGRVYNRYCSGPKDDVIHCLCGSFKEEGFMIQCDQCLSWQHGDCVEVDEDTPPEDYICNACSNPKGLRKQAKFKMDRAWFGSGKLLSLPNDPPFPHSPAVLCSNQLLDELMYLKRAHHAVKLLLQITSDASHPTLKGWSPEDNEEVTKHLVAMVSQALVHCAVPDDDSHEDSPQGVIPPQDPCNPHMELTDDVDIVQDIENTDDSLITSISPSKTDTSSPIDPVPLDNESHEDHMDIGDIQVVSGDKKEIKFGDNVAAADNDDVSCDRHMGSPGASDDSNKDVKTSLHTLPPLRSYSPTLRSCAASLLSLSGQKPRSLDPLPPQDGRFGMEIGSKSDSELTTMVSQAPPQMEESCKEETPIQTSEDPPTAKSSSSKEEGTEQTLGSVSGGVDGLLESVVVGMSPAVPSSIHCPIPVRSPVKTSFESVVTPLASTRSLSHTEQSPFKPLQSAGASDDATDRKLPESEASSQTIFIKVFADSYVRSNTSNWSSRMVLLEQVMSIQDQISERLEFIVKEIEALPIGSDPVITGKGSSKKNPLRKIIQELQHCLPTEHPKLVV